MSLDVLRLSRWLSLSLALALPVTAAGCAAEPQPDDPSVETDEGGEGATEDEITEVANTKVKRQSIGNCWLYAASSWVESLHKGVAGEELNTSETYLTYWDWYEKIANGTGLSDGIQTGGTYTTAAELINRYGLMLESDFVPAEATSEMSATQASAEKYINEALKNGELRTSTARKTKKTVRAVLNKAFGLSPAIVADMNAVFGVSTTKTLDKSYATDAKKLPAGSKVIRPRDFSVELPDPADHSLQVRSLQDAIGKRDGYRGRTGAYAWNEVDYPYPASSRRSFWQRVQRALHDNQPVMVSWFVDFNALTDDARFSKKELDVVGPGSQGGHMTLLSDYQIKIPAAPAANGKPARAELLLKAGVKATAEQLELALLPEAQIEFMRIKNSWGAFRPDRWKDAPLPGYHDLMWDYINGPIKQCSEDASGHTDPTSCYSQQTPLWDVVLPPGY
ncbi:MAG: hypothetical protein EOO75_01575 [Myxococcales bacterium]|nr:MAG: hypothetical protein EOO75_01575 [Myxococcales bacterium]